MATFNPFTAFQNLGNSTQVNEDNEEDLFQTVRVQVTLYQNGYVIKGPESKTFYPQTTENKVICQQLAQPKGTSRIHPLLAVAIGRQYPNKKNVKIQVIQKMDELYTTPIAQTVSGVTAKGSVDIKQSSSSINSQNIKDVTSVEEKVNITQDITCPPPVSNKKSVMIDVYYNGFELFGKFYSSAFAIHEQVVKTLLEKRQHEFVNDIIRSQVGPIDDLQMRIQSQNKDVPSVQGKEYKTTILSDTIVCLTNSGAAHYLTMATIKQSQVSVAFYADKKIDNSLDSVLAILWRLLANQFHVVKNHLIVMTIPELSHSALMVIGDLQIKGYEWIFVWCKGFFFRGKMVEGNFFTVENYEHQVNWHAVRSKLCNTTQYRLAVVTESSAYGSLDFPTVFCRTNSILFYDLEPLSTRISSERAILMQRAINDDPVAMRMIGDDEYSYQNNRKEGIEWLERAAAANDAKAMHLLGTYENNQEKALQWYEQAANLGYVSSIDQMIENTFKKPEEQMVWIQRRHETKPTQDSLFAKGLLCLTHPKYKDIPTALQCLEGSESSKGYQVLVAIYLSGIPGHVEVDTAKAQEYIREGSSKMNAICSAIENNKGPQAMLKALDEDEKNWRQNWVLFDTYFRLGKAHELGLGTKKDADKALKYYRLAHAAGDWRTMVILKRLDKLFKEEKKQESKKEPEVKATVKKEPEVKATPIVKKDSEVKKSPSPPPIPPKPPVPPRPVLRSPIVLPPPPPPVVSSIIPPLVGYKPMIQMPDGRLIDFPITPSAPPPPFPPSVIDAPPAYSE